MRKFHHKTDVCKPSVWLATFLCLPVNYKSIEYPMICQFCLFYSTLLSEKTDNVVYDEAIWIWKDCIKNIPPKIFRRIKNSKSNYIYQLKTQVGFHFSVIYFCKCLVLEKASSAAKLDYDTNVSIMILLADREWRL